MKKKRALRKKHRIKKKKPLLENNIVGGFFLFVLFLCGAFYFFTFYPLFQTESIVIKNAKNLKEEALFDFVEQRINKDFPLFSSRSILLISSEKTRRELLRKTSVIEDVKINKVFPATIEIEIKERDPFAVWCGAADKKSCYYLNKEGIVFQKADAIPRKLPLFIKEKEVTLGEVIVDNSFLQTLSLAERELLRSGVVVNYSRIPTAKTIVMHVDEGWKIHFSLDNIDKELANFPLVVKEIDRERRKNLDYIDLRFGDRIFYK